MRTLVLAGLFLSLAGLMVAAQPEPLTKVGEYHLKTERYGAAAVALRCKKFRTIDHMEPFSTGLPSRSSKRSGERRRVEPRGFEPLTC